MTRYTLTLVFVVALVARVLFVWGQTTFEWFVINFAGGDAQRYLHYAQTLASGQGLMSPDGLPTAAITPGYPFFLAALSFLGIESPYAIGLTQCFVGAATCVFFALIAERLGGRTTGIVAGLMAAAYPHFIVWTGYVLTETLYLFVLAAVLVVLLRCERRGSLALAGACGLLIGAAVMVRTTAAPVALLAPAWLLWARRRTPWSAVGLASTVVLGCAVVLAAWTMRNVLTMGAPIVLSTQGGDVLYHGFSPGATGGSRGYVDDNDFVRLQLPPGLSEVEADRYLRDAVAEFVRENTKAIPRLAFWKLVNMYRPFYADASVTNMLVLGGSYFGLVLLFAAGCMRTMRLGSPPPVFHLALLFLATQVVQHALTIGMIRFRLPSEMVFIVLGAVPLTPVRLLREHRQRMAEEGETRPVVSPTIGVLQIITRLNIGGTAQHVVSLTEGFRSPPFRSHLIVGRPNLSEGDMMPHLDMARVRCTVVPSLGRELHPISDVRAWLAIFRIIRRERPAIVHTHTAKAVAIGRTAALVHNFLLCFEEAGTRRRCRLVHTFHGHVLQGYFVGRKTRVYRWIERTLARITDRIIVVSQAVGDDLLLLGVGTPQSVRVVKLGIPLERLLSLPPLTEQPVTFIGSVGRLVPIKNHEMLPETEAMTLASCRRAAWWLVPLVYGLLLAAESVTLPGYDLGLRRFQTPPLGPEMRLAQTFLMTGDGLDAIEVFPVAAGKGVSGDIRFELHEIHEVGSDHRVTRLRVLEVLAEDLVRAPSYVFAFPAIADSRDRTYRFDLVAAPADSVALWATKGRRYAGGGLHANGRERWADLAFRVHAPAPTVWGRLMTLRETHPARA